MLPALALNYMGQGALLMRDPRRSRTRSTGCSRSLADAGGGAGDAAAIIASQAVISGAYSMTRQAIQLGFLPRMRDALHLGARGRADLHAGGELAAAGRRARGGRRLRQLVGAGRAYGIAVTVTMLITTLLTYFVVREAGASCLGGIGGDRFLPRAGRAAGGLLRPEVLHGGWFPLVLGAAIFVVMATWKRGREAAARMRADDPALLPLLQDLRTSHLPRPARTAVFPTADPGAVPQALLHNLRHNGVLHGAT